MKTVIRFGTFETNSSSVHSLVMCDKEDFALFEAGELVLNTDTEQFVPANSVNWDDEDSHWTYKTFDEYFNDNEYETFRDEYTSKSGDDIVGFGYYGHD